MRLQEAEEMAETRVKQKEEETLKKVEKWLSKHKELENRYSQLKKSATHEQINLEKEKHSLVEQLEQHRKIEHRLEDEIKAQMSYQRNLQTKCSSLDDKIGELESRLEEKIESNLEFKRLLERSHLEIVHMRE